VVDVIRPSADWETTVDRARAHHALTTHVPVRDWRWLGLRLRCRHCGQRYPCPPRRQALAQLADGLGGR
jgi:hypothetical protein